jgi:putative AlgH/UPF0301 family transcriptional regulator
MARDGDLLIAPPSLSHSTFAGTVIILARSEPAMGFVLNRTSGTVLNRIAPTVEQHGHSEIYWGGPVNTHTVWMLHSTDWRMHNSVDVNSQWAVTSNIQMFDRVNQVGWPQYWRVFAGCAVWQEGQLTREIEQLSSRDQGWLVAHAPPADQLLDTPHRDLWQASCEWAKIQAVAQWF